MKTYDNYEGIKRTISGNNQNADLIPPGRPAVSHYEVPPDQPPVLPDHPSIPEGPYPRPTGREAMHEDDQTERFESDTSRQSTSADGVNLKNRKSRLTIEDVISRPKSVHLYMTIHRYMHTQINVYLITPNLYPYPLPRNPDPIPRNPYRPILAIPD
jgi:hypothetical protein